MKHQTKLITWPLSLALIATHSLLCLILQPQNLDSHWAERASTQRLLSHSWNWVMGAAQWSQAHQRNPSIKAKKEETPHSVQTESTPKQRCMSECLETPRNWCAKIKAKEDVDHLHKSFIFNTDGVKHCSVHGCVYVFLCRCVPESERCPSSINVAARGDRDW